MTFVTGDKIGRRTKRVPTPREEASYLRNIVLPGDNNPALQGRCQKLGIKGYSRMNRKQLINAIIRKTFDWSIDWSEDWLDD